MPDEEKAGGDIPQPEISALRWQLYNDHKKQAWEDIQSSTDSYDQSLLTLSSGGLGLSIAFIKDIAGLQNAVWLWLLYSSWAAFAVCILTTLISFQIAIKTQEELLVNCGKYYLDDKKEYRDKRGGFSKALTACTIAAGAFFILALIFTITFAVRNIEVSKMTKLQEGRAPVSMTPIPTTPVPGGTAPATSKPGTAPPPNPKKD